MYQRYRQTDRQTDRQRSYSVGQTVFERPFVKRFALCYQTVACPVLSVLSVTLVYCGKTVGWIKMKLGTKVGLGPGHILLDGDPAPLPKRDGGPNFRPTPIVVKVQTAAWIKMPLSTEVGLGLRDIVLDGDPNPKPSPKGA